MKHLFKIIFGSWIIVSAIIFTLVLFTSCSTSRKSIHKEQVSIDSTGTTVTDSVSVVRKDSTGSKTEEGQYKIWKEYVYDTIYVPGDSVVRYVPRILKVYEEGTFKKAEASAISQYDSTSRKNENTGSIKKDIKTTNRAIEKKRPPVLAAAAGLLLVIGIVLFVLKIINRKP